MPIPILGKLIKAFVSDEGLADAINIEIDASGYTGSGNLDTDTKERSIIS